MKIREKTEQIKAIPGQIKTLAALAIAALLTAIIALLAAIR